MLRTRLSRLLGLIAVLCLPLAAAAQDFEANRHYRVLPTPVNTQDPSKVEVVELFWYGCPHCYRLEPLVEEWARSIPDNVDFVRMPAVLNPSWEVGARAYLVAESLGVLDKVHQPMFDAIHAERRPMQGADDVAALFTEQGVERAAFDQAWNSFQVETHLRRARQLGDRYGVSGVPAVVVNGKYETSVSMAGSPERLFEVVNFLVAQEAAAR